MVSKVLRSQVASSTVGSYTAHAVGHGAVLFGDEWADAIPVVRLLAVASFIQGMVFSAGSALVAAGRPRSVNMAQITAALTLIPCMVVAARFSITAVAAVHILGVLVFGNVKLVPVCRVLSLSWRTVMQSVWRLAPAVMAMVVMLEVVRSLIASWPDIATLMITVGAGVVVYAIAVTVLLANTVQQIRQLAVAALKGS